MDPVPVYHFRDRILNCYGNTDGNREGTTDISDYVNSILEILMGLYCKLECLPCLASSLLSD